MTLATGARLGPYEIVAPLGAGGMGEVYRARDTRLHRDVALKLLAADDARAGERLLQEARHASALNHPNICTLYEIGDADGQPFLVMELVDGDSLDRRIGAGGLPLPTVLRLAGQIAEGLAHAHARGVIHRDLKTANVAVTAEGRAKILDFGIARRMSTAALADATRSVATLTADQEIAGTLPYMAPEVLEGRPADARSDLWALGVILIEMATGRRPFSGSSGVSLSTAILRDDPVVAADMPAPLADVARTLLAKDPARRYQSASEVSATIERLSTRDTLPATAVPSSRRSWLTRAAIVLLGVAVGASAWWGFAGRTGGAPAGTSIGSIAVLPLENLASAGDQEYFADGMTEALISNLSAIGELRVISRTSVMQFKGTTRSLAEIAQALKVDAVVEGAVMRTADRVRITARLIDARTEQPIWRGEYEKPLSDAITLQREVASTIGREIRGELSPSQAAQLARRSEVNAEAYQSYLRGRFHWNLRDSADLMQAVTFFREAISRDPGFALAHAGLADAYVVMGDYRDMKPSDAYRHAQEAVDIALKLDPFLAEAHTTRAWLAFAVERNWELAEQSFQRALELNPGYATAHQWHGEFLVALERFDEAFAALKRARELDPLGLMPPAIHGWALYFAGRYAEAIALCDEILERDPSFRPARMYRAWSNMDEGRLDEAEREIRALLQISSSNPAVPIATLGRIHARRGERRAAMQALEELRALSYPPSFDIAKLHAELRNRDETLEWLRRADVELNSAVLYVRGDRAFAWLHGDPAFTQLLERLNLQ